MFLQIFVIVFRFQIIDQKTEKKLFCRKNDGVLFQLGGLPLYLLHSFAGNSHLTDFFWNWYAIILFVGSGPICSERAANPIWPLIRDEMMAKKKLVIINSLSIW